MTSGSNGNAKYGAWEPVIGLEIHAQLLTRTKLFCGCKTSFGAEPNRHVCPVCLGLPGALPVLNRAAVELAIRAAVALDCRVCERSVFARKNYFYPDLPKGYQISQYDEPLALAGKLAIDADRGARTVGITRIHMEEDAGKNVHASAAESLVDLNRAGTPLIEIVGEPDLRSAAEARDYMKRLRDVLIFIGVNDGNLEQGSFRCDANVSIRRAGEPFGIRAEMKNINSFRFVEEAIDVEIRRQIRILERGGALAQQTRGYNADKRESYLLREKEGDAGYRYFPDPDLPPLVVDAADIVAAREALPELPAARRERYMAEWGVAEKAAAVLTSHPAIAAYFEAAVARNGLPLKTANFVQSEVLRDFSSHGLSATFPAPAEHVADLLTLVDGGSISGKQAKRVFSVMKERALMKDGAATPEASRGPEAIVEELGLRVISDPATLRKLAQELVAKHPQQAQAYRAGKQALLGFFVGQLMKATSGSADPKLASTLLRAELDSGA